MTTESIRPRPGRRLLTVVVALAVVLAGVPVPVAATDDEPNDTRALASDLAVDTEITGSLSASDGEDWYVLAVPEGQHVQVTVTRPSSATSFVRVSLFPGDSRFAAGGAVGVFPGQSRTVGDTATTTGPYFVQVVGDDGSYRLLAEVETPLASEREPNEDADAASPFALIDRTTLDAYRYVGDEDWYAIPVERGESIEVEITRPNRGTSFLGVSILREGSTGSADFGSVRPGGSLGLGTVAVADTTYFVQVGTAGSGEGPYTVTARTFRTDLFEPNDDAIDAAALNAGDTVRPRMTVGDVDFFTVPASIGDNVEASVTWDDGEDPSGAGSALRLRLFPPGSDGVGVALSSTFVNQVGDTAFVGDTAEDDGRYLIQVESQQAAVGNYTLAVTAERVDETEPNERQRDATPLLGNPFPDDVSTTLSAGDDADWYAFDASAGQRIGVRATRDASDQIVSVTVALHDESTRVDQVFLSPDETETIGFVVPADGRYAVSVDSSAGASETYRLEITLDGEPIGLPNDVFEPNDDPEDPTPLELLPGPYVGLRIVDDDLDAFGVELTGGATFVADAFATDPAGNLTLSLVDPSGAVVASTVAGTAPTIRYVVPEGGSHVLLVRGADSDGGDPAPVVGYDLHVRELAVLSGGLSPATVTLEPNGTAAVDVVLGGASGGLSAVDLRLAVADPSVATIDAIVPDATVEEGGGSVSSSADGPTATLNVSDVAVEPGELLTVATVTLLGGTDGETALTLSVDRAVDASGEPYDPRGIDGLVVVSSGPGDVTGNGLPALDLDGDGRFEDVDGSGTLEFIDVIELLFAFDRFDDRTGTFFDFDDSGALDFLDVIDLLFQV